jgi:acetylornithine deacetylase
VPTLVHGGQWLVSYPDTCTLSCHVQYLPEQADERGWGSAVEREFTQFIAEATKADPWLREHPPRVEWPVAGVPPSQVAADHPVVVSAHTAASDVGGGGRISGFDNWHDGATLTVEGGIPAICFGPGEIHLAHTTSESVRVTELVRCAQGLAVAAMRFCGVAAV